MNKNTKRRLKTKHAGAKKMGTISENKERNMRMVVRVNCGEGMVGNSSLTSHEPINKDLPFVPYKKKHYKRDTPETN